MNTHETSPFGEIDDSLVYPWESHETAAAPRTPGWMKNNSSPANITVLAFQTIQAHAKPVFAVVAFTRHKTPF